jgi:hypothetical protein
MDHTNKFMPDVPDINIIDSQDFSNFVLVMAAS